MRWPTSITSAGRRQSRDRRQGGREIRCALKFAQRRRASYLSLDRGRADTLSVARRKRIRLASQIGSGLTGVMYVLDEPSIGCTSATTRA